MTARNARLSPALQRALIVMARAAPRVEVCALLGGRDNQLTSIYPVSNIADDPTTRFLLDPEGQIDAMKAMREVDEDLRGIFHSHPASSATPSATDEALASYPDVYYLIVSLADELTELRAYYYDGSAFTAVDIDTN